MLTSKNKIIRDASELLALIQKGESSGVQFKERIPHTDSLAQEMVAFSNTDGGIIIIGVNDKTGALNGLSFKEIQATNQQLVNIASQSIYPSIVIKTETVNANGQNIIIVEIKEGESKPYKDRNGIIFVKNGSDKRKVTSNEELSRLLQSSKTLYADEILIPGTSIDDIDKDYFKRIFEKKYKISFDNANVDIATSLQNQQLCKDGKLTLSGLLLFCKNRHSFKPQFSIQCISVNALNLSGNSFEDNEPAFEGKIADVFYHTLNFIDRNMKKKPSGTSFNSELKWEIPQEVFEEILVNALIHRDYFINATIKVFIFSDRIEIISPGKLPNSQTEQTIVSGISVPRNPILQSIAQYVLPYRGIGTGIMRALSMYPDIQFKNEQSNERFVATIIKH